MKFVEASVPPRETWSDTEERWRINERIEDRYLSEVFHERVTQAGKKKKKLDLLYKFSRANL